MATDLPPDLTSIENVGDHKYKNINVMGVIVDFLAPKLTRGTDWMCTFSIVDQYSRCEGQRVRYFAKKYQDLPKLQGVGDVILLRDIQFRDYQGSGILLSNFNTTWTTFNHKTIPKTQPSGDLELPFLKSHSAPTPSAAEMTYASVICNSQDRSTFHDSSPASEQVSTGAALLPRDVARDKSATISDIGADTFYDLTGRVVKLYQTNDRLDVSITDYTSNELLFNYEQQDDETRNMPMDGDPHGYMSARRKKKWPGPFGKKTLTVTLFSPHSGYALQRLKEGMYVTLKNVHIKLGKDLSGKLEGAIHEDRNYPDRICVAVLDATSPNPYLRELLKRQKEYEKIFKPESPEHTGAPKRRRADEIDKPSKASRKRARANMKKKESMQGNIIDPAGSGSRETARRGTSITKLQRPVTCIKPDQPIRTVSAILSVDRTHNHKTPGGISYTLPFQNLCSRALLRVVDFKPSNLEDFAVLESASDRDNPSDSEESDADKTHDSGNEDHFHEWKWRFALLLEDCSAASKSGGVPKDRLIAYVEGNDAEFLLNMAPTDLRKDEDALATLREKLFILWGDLEECKTKSADQDASKGAPTPRSTQHETVLKENNGNTRLQQPKSCPEKMTDDTKTVVKKFTTSSNPFHCCIREYGIKSQGGKWERRFRLSGTTIK